MGPLKVKKADTKNEVGIYCKDGAVYHITVSTETLDSITEAVVQGCWLVLQPDEGPHSRLVFSEGQITRISVKRSNQCSQK